MVIYKITNLLNGKIYIGKDSKNNPKYFGSGRILKLSIKKNGIENFKKDIIDQCESESELNEKEIFWINHYKSTNKEIGYNLTFGGTGGNTVLNEEQKIEKYKKIREINLKLSSDERSKKYGVNKGKIGINFHSEETKKKLSESNTGEKNGMFGKDPWNKGKLFSDETKHKMSESRKGKPAWNKGIKMTEEQKENLSDKMRGRKTPDDTKIKISESLKNSEKKKLSDNLKKEKSSWNKGKKTSDETKEKIRNKLLGIINMTKGSTWMYNIDINKYKRVSSNDIEDLLLNGWIKRSPRTGNVLSIETKKKISNTIKMKNELFIK